MVRQRKESFVINLLSFTIAVHGLSATIWVGGMFFAYVCLRPSVTALEPPQRLQLWAEVFRRFFFWVWIVVIALPLAGYVQIIGVYDGFENVGLYMHIMHVMGWVMIGLFVLLYFYPYRLFRAAVSAQDWPVAARHLNMIRQIVGINLVFGLIVIVIATAGRFWGLI